METVVSIFIAFPIDYITVVNYKWKLLPFSSWEEEQERKNMMTCLVWQIWQLEKQKPYEHIVI
jgi:hypothetical protein